MVETSHSHRPSGLHQSNKPFKSKHASKSSLKEKLKGRINRTSRTSSKKTHHQTKASRRNAAKVIQLQRQREITEIRKRVGYPNGAPKLVILVGLSQEIDLSSTINRLYLATNLVNDESNGVSSMECDSCFGKSVYLEAFKQKFMLVAANREILHVLDLARVADFIVFVFSAEHPVDDFGNLIITCIKSQGLPSSLALLERLDTIPLKKQSEVRRDYMDLFKFHIPEGEKSFFSNESSDVIKLLRHISSHTPHHLHWRKNRSYMMIDHTEFVESQEDDSLGHLKITGYVRGKALNANQLIHFQGIGQFQIDKIVSASDTRRSTTKPSNHRSNDVHMEEVIISASDAFQESLDSLHPADNQLQEQTVFTEEEMERADAATFQRDFEEQSKTDLLKIPSDYQSAWIANQSEESDYDSALDGESIETDMEPDHEGTDPFLFKNFEKVDESNSLDDAFSSQEEISNDEEFTSGQRSVQFAEDLELTSVNSREDNHLRMEEKEDLEFPDEVTIPSDITARVRFQKYRGLQSLRHSSWDSFENLPKEYARIFQFQNFSRSKQRVLLHNDGAEEGTYVTVYIKSISRLQADAAMKSSSMFALLPYEQKVSVINFVIRKHSSYDDPVKSKDPLVFCCGLRRFIARPVFSQYTRGDKHKFEKFLQAGRTLVATTYGPVHFPPCPVLIFRGETATDLRLVATGQVMDANPSRVILKRIIFTGDPFKIHKKSAVIRRMFFNPEDISWFKPVQLVTKQGRIGHICDSIGTHGHMRCIFDGPLKAQDTVCMHLYKRIFPKWDELLLNKEID